MWLNGWFCGGQGERAGVQQWGRSEANLASDSLAEPCREMVTGGQP